jgi:hypothetical protein
MLARQRGAQVTLLGAAWMAAARPAEIAASSWAGVCARSSRELITQREPMRWASWILLIRCVPDFPMPASLGRSGTPAMFDSRGRRPAARCSDAAERGH